MTDCSILNPFASSMTSFGLPILDLKKGKGERLALKKMGLPFKEKMRIRGNYGILGKIIFFY